MPPFGGPAANVELGGDQRGGLGTSQVAPGGAGKFCWEEGHQESPYFYQHDDSYLMVSEEVKHHD